MPFPKPTRAEAITVLWQQAARTNPAELTPHHHYDVMVGPASPPVRGPLPAPGWGRP